MAPGLPSLAAEVPRPREFTIFSALPAELRIKIWQHTFEPRVLELHSKRKHVEGPDSGLWCSACGNPVTLSVCRESRAETLSVYRVALPLCDKNGDPIGRPLYMSPAVDTVAMLGQVDYDKLSSVFSAVEGLDPSGMGLRRVALSINGWYHGSTGQILQLWSKGLFRNLERFLLLMYTESQPPSNFHGGECGVEECLGMDSFLTLIMGPGSQLKKGNGWLVVGKTEMRIMYLNFITGSWTR